MSKSGKNSGSKNRQQQDAAPADIENTGNYLRTLRLSKGLSIKDVTEATRISETNLNAMENMDFSSLPANTFTRGLLNNYANFLGADAKTVVPQFMAERESSQTQKRRTRQSYSRKILTPKRLAEPAQISSITMAGILFLFIVVTFTGYCVYNSWNPFSILMKENNDIHSVMESVFPTEKHPAMPAAREEVITVPAEPSSGERSTATDDIQIDRETTTILPGEATTAPGASLPGQQTDPLTAKYTIQLSFLEDATITLTRENGETTVEEFKAGDLHSWAAETPITMTFAQPGSAAIQVNSVPVVFPAGQDGLYTLRIPQDIAPQDE